MIFFQCQDTAPNIIAIVHLSPDNITTLVKRWANVGNSVGPTQIYNVGPTSVCHLARRWPNVGKSATLALRWPNVGMNATLVPQGPNVGTLDDWPLLGHRGATVGQPCNAGTAVLPLCNDLQCREVIHSLEAVANTTWLYFSKSCNSQLIPFCGQGKLNHLQVHWSRVSFSLYQNLESVILVAQVTLLMSYCR